MNVEEARAGEDRGWSLADPVRRALYRYVVRSRGDVSRAEASAALGLPAHVAKFQLDRLEDDGLLDVEYRRPAGRSGPGAGRPTKRYRPHDEELSVSVPNRNYDVLGEVMAAAIESAAASGIDITPSLATAARARGEALGAEASSTEEALDIAGYEPATSGEGVVLVNCPFHRLAQRHTELVCGVNLALVEGIIASSDRCQEWQARLEPQEGRCCITLNRS